MRKYLFLFTFLLLSAKSFAQDKDFNYKFYGQIRTDFYYNSRANEETVDGLFYMYPKDKVYDATGKDLNATANGSFYTLYTRLGIDVQGPKLGRAKTSAKVEMDFRGSGTTFSTVRLRHAYLNLDWGKPSLLLGQTWHPLYGDVAPQILNLNMGAPFQPFSRAPQIRFRYKAGDIQLTGAAIWQSQYLSQGPDGKSQKYIKESCIPEIYIGADYKRSNWLVGAGIEMISLKPRTQSVVEDEVYKVGYQYEVINKEFSAKEDFPSGGYDIERSNAAMSLMKIIKNAFEGDFSKYLSEGKQVKVIVTGSADASPIRGRIAYNGQYGEFIDEPYYKDGNLDNITVTKASGITANEQLALMRAAGVKNYIEKNVTTLDNTKNEYEYHVEVAKERGGEFRKINVEFVIMDAFPAK
mgnify:CR=1 FL=1